MDSQSRSNGIFSQSLLCMELHLRTLFEGAGGERTVQLLDRLSSFSPSQQDKLLDLFCRATERFTGLSDRLPQTEADRKAAQLEEQLLSEISEGLDAISSATPEMRGSRGGLTVIQKPQRRAEKNNVIALPTRAMKNRASDTTEQSPQKA